MAMPRKVHVFDNGVRVYDDHLLPSQRERYAKRNVHEADEEDLFVELVRHLPADGCYVNIGCAIGYYPLLAKRLAPALTVHAVEPLAQHRKYFAENVRLNGLDSADFTLHERALAAAEGKAQFLEDRYSSVLHTGPHQATKPAKIVSTTTLDALVATIGRTVNLVQMDVQGSEAEVLRGGVRALRAGRVETFLIGTHGQEIHQECAEELQRYGYGVELSEPVPKDQPDGILIASKGVRG
jgi:FkbM family methyltransferase